MDKEDPEMNVVTFIPVLVLPEKTMDYENQKPIQKTGIGVVRGAAMNNTFCGKKAFSVHSAVC